MIEVTCSWCSATIHKYPSQVKNTNFCNLGCLGKYRSAYLTGPSAANWKGGMRTDRGRVQLFRPDHHRADAHGYVYRYWIVAEEKIGRPLLPEEVVHHIDDDHTNDDPDNLQVLPNQAEHARLHGFQRTPEQMEAMRNARRSAA